MAKNLPANGRDVRDSGSILGWEDPLEEGMATHSSILAWRMPWTEESGGLQSVGSQRVNRTDLACTCKTRSEEALQLPAGCLAVHVLGEQPAL